MKKLLHISSILIGSLLLLGACNHKSGLVNPESVGLSSDTLNLAQGMMQEFLDSGKFAGISTLVIKDGKAVHRSNIGFADIENEKPMSDSAIFRIFSMTKPVTAVALMILFDEGKFQLDDKVSDYIKDFEDVKVYNPEVKPDSLEPQNKEMTIRNLLTHTSGITYGWNPNSYVDRLYVKSKASGWDAPLSDKVKILSKLPLKYQPGTRWEYSLSIDVAGYLVEVLSGMPLDTYLKTKVFNPLKMFDTDFYVPEKKHDRLAALYYVSKDGKLKNARDTLGMSFKKLPQLISGGGGLVSTMDDYARFCQMLLNRGELDGVRVIKESTADLIMSNQLPEGVKYREGYGLGGQVNLKTGEYSWGGSINQFLDKS